MACNMYIHVTAYMLQEKGMPLHEEGMPPHYVVCSQICCPEWGQRTNIESFCMALQLPPNLIMAAVLHNAEKLCHVGQFSAS
jgi:hypothetical protein